MNLTKPNLRVTTHFSAAVTAAENFNNASNNVFSDLEVALKPPFHVILVASFANISFESFRNRYVFATLTRMIQLTSLNK